MNLQPSTANDPRPQSIANDPRPQSTAIDNPAPQRTTTCNPYHEFVIHNPRSTTEAMRVRARHGANEVLGFIEVEFWNLGFFVCGFCWLMRFWLIYEVLGVWVDGYCWTISPPRWKWRLWRKLQKRAEKWERGERWERKYIILRYIILLCRYIILMSKRGK